MPHFNLKPALNRKPQLSGLGSKISSLPGSPGVYRFLNETGGVLYIGKAKNLRARVRQYFAGLDGRPQIPYLMKEAADLDYTVVNTELESLYLERTLIQKYRPKYNIELKDDKNYAFIIIDYSTEIPQIIVIRKIQSPSPSPSPSSFAKATADSQGRGNKGVFFGPYTSTKKIRDLIFTARRVFGLCGAKKTGKPCFYFHLHRCPGVCASLMTIDDYKKHLDKIKLFFSGKIAPAIKSIKTEMQAAAKQKKFEKAARLRDQLKALEMLGTKQNVILTKPVDWDVINFSLDEGTGCINLFKIRAGRMLNKENFIYAGHDFSGRSNRANNEILQAFLETYYSEASDVPKEILLPIDIDDAGLIKTLIKDRFKKSINIAVPKKGKARQLIQLSQTNAQEYLKNYLNEKAGHLDKVQRGLAQLKEILGLPSIPKRIEGFDISNIQGTNPVGSMVVFVDGLPAKSEYRKFKIKNRTVSADLSSEALAKEEGLPKADDFAMMREMIARRISRSSKNQNPRTKNAWSLPDLMVVDGGRGQLNAALETIRSIRFSDSSDFPVIGLAKRIEEIFLPHQKHPIMLPHDNPALQLLQRLRDEAHRFGIVFHRKLRSKQAIKSALDDILGIGPKTKKLLKAKFGTVADIRKAGLNELTEAVGKKMAKKIKNEL